MPVTSNPSLQGTWRIKPRQSSELERWAIRMIDDLVELAVAAAIDVEAEKGAKNHRWVRIFRALVGLFFFALIVGSFYITVKYS